MITPIQSLPEGVLGIEASGSVSATDYTDVLDPLLEAGLAQRRKVRLLYVLGADFDGFSAGGAWEDTKVGVQHFASFERVAVVSDHSWLRDGIRAFGWIMPGKLRTFSLAERPEAVAWLAE